MKKRLIGLIVPLFIVSLSLNSWADTSLPKKKQTDLGLYVTAVKAFAKWHTNPEEVKILDVRTPGEYIFVGHAPMAANIPLRFLNASADAATKRPVMPMNDQFVEDVKKKFNKTDTIFVMCRSGARSAAAVNILANAGFKNVYNITDGFEGDKLKIEGSYNNGKRLVNGWKNSGAPWTYKLEPHLVYQR
jgi:rhodanese-related sulfurtransferase